MESGLQKQHIAGIILGVAVFTAALFLGTGDVPAGAQTACVAPPSGMVSWWPGDGNANDIQGTNHATLQNGATFAAGKVDQSFSLDGLNDFVSVPHSTSWEFGANDFTIDFWLYKVSNLHGYIARDGTTLFSPWIIGSNDLIYMTSTGSSWNIVSGASMGSIPVNTWTHIAVTRSGSTFRAYNNGNVASTWTSSAALAPNSNPLSIGKVQNQTNFSGRIDELEIFNRALMQTEIQSIVNAGSAGKCKQPVPPPAPVCGNTVVESGEQCDDGNALSGDGCSATCQVEACIPGPTSSFTSAPSHPESVDIPGLAYGPNASGQNVIWIGSYLGTGTMPEGTIVEMNPATGAIITTHPNLGVSNSGPGGLAYDSVSAGGPYLWVANYNDGAVYKVRISDYTRASSFPVGGFCGRPLDGVAFDGTNLWLSCPEVSRVFKLTTAGAVVSSHVGVVTAGIEYANGRLFTVEPGVVNVRDTNFAIIRSYPFPDATGCANDCNGELSTIDPVSGDAFWGKRALTNFRKLHLVDTCQAPPPAPVCGNSIVESGEQCDDGNTASGDGCSSTCQNDVTVTGTPSSSTITPSVQTTATAVNIVDTNTGTTVVSLPRADYNLSAVNVEAPEGSVAVTGLTLPPNTTKTLTVRKDPDFSAINSICVVDAPGATAVQTLNCNGPSETFVACNGTPVTGPQGQSFACTVSGNNLIVSGLLNTFIQQWGLPVGISVQNGQLISDGMQFDGATPVILNDKPFSIAGNLVYDGTTGIPVAGGTVAADIKDSANGVVVTLTGNADVNGNFVLSSAPITTQDLYTAEVDATDFTFSSSLTAVPFRIRSQNPGPDLVGGITLPNTELLEQTAVSGTVRVSNVGDQLAGTSAWQLLMIVDGTPALIAQGSAEAINPNNTQSFPFSFTAPAAVPSPLKPFALRLDVDIANAVAEANENNNRQFANAESHAAGPDIIISQLSTVPANVFFNAGPPPGSLTVRVKNRGELSAAASTLNLVFDGAAMTGAPFAVPALASGEEFTATTQLPQSAVGVHAVVATADAGNAVAEWKETNNTSTLYKKYYSDLPDVVPSISGIVTAPDAQSFTASVRIYNIEGGAASAFTVRTYLDGALIDTRSVAGLGGFGNSMGFQVVGTTSFGTHQLRVEADADGQVSEFNENNNAVTTTFSLITSAAPGPDAKVTSQGIVMRVGGTSVNGVNPGGNATMEVTVSNVGGQSANTQTRLTMGTQDLGTSAGQTIAPGASALYAFPYVAPSSPGTIIGFARLVTTGDVNPQNDGATRAFFIGGPSVLFVLPNTPTVSGNVLVQVAASADATNVEVKYNGVTIGSGAPVNGSFSFVWNSLSNVSAGNMQSGTLAAVATNVQNLAGQATQSIMVDNRVVIDLVATGMTAPASVQPDQSVMVTVSVQNLGALGAQNVRIRVTDGGTVLGEQVIAAIAAGETLDVPFTIAVGLPLGTHTLRGVVDPLNEIPETNEANNAVTAQTTVEVLVDPDGDGIARDIDTDPVNFSNDFDTRPLGGTTYGTIMDRGGFIVGVEKTAALDARVDVTGAGSKAKVSSCDNQVITEYDSGESAEISCGVNSTVIRALSGTIRWRKPPTGRGARGNVTAPDTITVVGDPKVIAASTNTAVSAVEVVDDNDAVVASCDLKPADRLDVTPRDTDENLVLKNEGSVAIACVVDGAPVTLAPGGIAVDQCSGLGGNIAGTGCPVADKNVVTLHTVNIGGGASTKAPLAGATARVFDRNSAAFQAVAGSKNPDGALYGVIYEADAGRVGACVTGSDGICYAGERAMGDYLVVVKYTDGGTGKTVYIGRLKSPSDFFNGLAEKDFQIMKVFRKGIFQEYRGGSKLVVTGSMLEVILPESAVWEGAQSLYPFIFSSDSDWQIDVCAKVPDGYNLVGVYDESGNLISSAQCVQAGVANETKVIAFEVKEVASPEPSFVGTLNVKHKGKVTPVSVRVSDMRRASFNAKLKAALERAQNASKRGERTVKITKVGASLWSVIRDVFGLDGKEAEIMTVGKRIARLNAIRVPEWGIMEGAYDAGALPWGFVLDLDGEDFRLAP